MLSGDVKCAIIVLCELALEKESDKGLLMKELKIRCSFPRKLNRVMTILRRNGIVSYNISNGFYRYRADSDMLTLYDLVLIIDGGLRMGIPDPNCDWPRAKREYELAHKTDVLLKTMVERYLKSVLIMDFWKPSAKVTSNQENSGN